MLALETRLARATPARSARRAPVRLRQAVRLESVSFRYEEGAEPALVSVSLTIPAGQTTAIVGPSGSGKSTARRSPAGIDQSRARGRVLVDETPLTPELLPAWREQIGYVPQDSFHFHDTVRANLLVGAPGGERGGAPGGARGRSRRLRRSSAPGARHRAGRPRGPAVGWRAPAGRPGPRPGPPAGDAHPRRGHEQPRFGERAARAGRHRAAARPPRRSW